MLLYCRTRANASIKTELVTAAYTEIINIHTDLRNNLPLEHKNVNLEALTRAVLTQLVARGIVDGEDVVKQSNGTYKIESNLVLYVDQASDNHDAKLVFESNNNEEVYLKVTFTPSAILFKVFKRFNNCRCSFFTE